MAEGNSFKNGNGWLPISIMAGIVVALMAPGYQMISALREDMAGHIATPGHPETTNQLAALSEHQAEIEEQFDGVKDRIRLEHENLDTRLTHMKESMDVDDAREAGDIAAVATLEAEIAHLKEAAREERDMEALGSLVDKVGLLMLEGRGE